MKKTSIERITERLDPSERLDLWAELLSLAQHITEIADDWWDRDDAMRLENASRFSTEDDKNP